MSKPAMQPGGWTRQQLESDTSWVYLLSRTQIAEFKAAMRHAKATGKSFCDLSPDDFPIGQDAQRALDAVIEGTQGLLGLKVLRGFPVDRFDADSMRMLFWGIGLHLGVPRPQGKQSQFMSDVTDAGGVYRSSTGRGYNTN